MTDTFASQVWLFWLYLGAGALAFASAGLLAVASIRIRDLLAMWLAFLLLSVAMDFYAKAVLRSPNPQITLELAFGILRFAAAGCVVTIIGVTDCWFSQHNGHLDGIRRLMYWWRIFNGGKRMNMNSEPAITANGIVAAISAVVAALIAFGVIEWTPEQRDAFMAATIAILGVVLPTLATWWIRRNTTSLADPRDADGQPLTRADNSPALRSVRAVKAKKA